MKRRLEYFIVILYSISNVMAMHFNHDQQCYVNVNLR